MEGRFESGFGNALAAMLAAPPPLKSTDYWSLAALDSIDKANCMPLKRDGIIKLSPHTQPWKCTDVKRRPRRPQLFLAMWVGGLHSKHAKIPAQTRQPRSERQIYVMFIARYVPGLPKEKYEDKNNTKVRVRFQSKRAQTQKLCQGHTIKYSNANGGFTAPIAIEASLILKKQTNTIFPWKTSYRNRRMKIR